MKVAPGRITAGGHKAGMLARRTAGSRGKQTEGFGNQEMAKAAGSRWRQKKEEAGRLRLRKKEEAGRLRKKEEAGRRARGATIWERALRVAAGSRLPSISIIPIITGPGPGLRAGL